MSGVAIKRCFKLLAWNVVHLCLDSGLNYYLSVTLIGVHVTAMESWEQDVCLYVVYFEFEKPRRYESLVYNQHIRPIDTIKTSANSFIYRFNFSSPLRPSIY